MAARIAVRQRARLGGELLDERVGDLLVDDSRSVDMQICPMIGEAAEGRGLHGLVEIGVVEDDHRRLAAELEQHGLEDSAPRSRR